MGAHGTSTQVVRVNFLPDWSRMKKIAIIPAAGVMHLVVTAGLLLAAAGASIGGMDTGAEPTSAARALDALVTILLYPLFAPVSTFGGQGISGVGAYLLLIGNSLVWGLAIYGLVMLMRRRAHA